MQDGVKGEHCAIRENTVFALSEVLSEEQMEELETIQSQRGNRSRGFGMSRFANCET